MRFFILPSLVVLQGALASITASDPAQTSETANRFSNFEFIESIKSGSLFLVQIREAVPSLIDQLSRVPGGAVEASLLSSLHAESEEQFKSLETLYERLKVLLNETSGQMKTRFSAPSVTHYGNVLPEYHSALNEIKTSWLPRELQKLGSPLSVDFSQRVSKYDFARQIAIYEVKTYLNLLKSFNHESRSSYSNWQFEKQLSILGTLLFTKPYSYETIENFLKYFPEQRSINLQDMYTAAEQLLTHRYPRSRMPRDKHKKNFNLVMNRLISMTAISSDIQSLAETVHQVISIRNSNPRFRLDTSSSLLNTNPKAASVIQLVHALERVREARLEAHEIFSSVGCSIEKKLRKLEDIEFTIARTRPRVDDISETLTGVMVNPKISAAIVDTILREDHSIVSDLISKLSSNSLA
ncbi:hypothetical protein C9890_0042 [Perkinsus sp. BL_2016]|nr:hypothetical protein C9890_0042 [Perkinsus sp. BL_2016]